jgi:hypothetical protein
MSSIAPSQSTQFIAMKLINDIITQDEGGIKKRIAHDITLTSEHNGGSPVVKHGQAEYLEAIRSLWSQSVAYKYGGFSYGEFTPTSGTLHFTHICVVKRDQEDAFMLAEGTQAFTFENGRINSISVVETDTFLTPEAYESTMAKVRGQENKIVGYMGSNASANPQATTETFLSTMPKVKEQENKNIGDVRSNTSVPSKGWCLQQ